MQPGSPDMRSAFRPVLNTWESCQGAAQLKDLLSKMHSIARTSLRARCLRCSSSLSALNSDMLCSVLCVVLGPLL